MGATSDTLFFLLRNRILGHFVLSQDTLSNISIALDTLLAAPVLSIGSGTFEDVQTARISSSDANASLHCTLDGGLPTKASPLCPSILEIGKSTRIRSMASFPDGSSGHFSDDSVSILPRIVGIGKLTSAWGKASFQINDNSYLIWANGWNLGSGNQVLSWSPSGLLIESQTATSMDANPVSSPCLSRSAVTGRNSVTSGYPLRRHSLTALQMGWRHEGQNVPGRIEGKWLAYLQAEFDTAQVTTLPSQELRIFLDSGAIVAEGLALIDSNLQFDELPGKWDLAGRGQPVRMIAFVPKASHSTLSLDLRPLLDALDQRFPTGSAYWNHSTHLHSTSACFDIWSGGAGLLTNIFTARVP